MIFTPENLNPHRLPADPVTYDNLALLSGKLNAFMADYRYPLAINSGLRDQALQKKVNPLAPKSNHLLGLAADIHDEANKLLEYVLSNLEKARDLGLFFENPNWTPTWVHIQSVAPKSGHRFFIPDSSPSKCSRWSGIYDSKFDVG